MRSGRLAAALSVLLLGGACSADRYAERGRRALDEHRLADAEADFRAALARDPAHAGALAGLGWTYRLAGRDDAARAAFERCAEVDPTRAECLRGLADVALAEGRPDEARRRVARALALAPDDPGAQVTAALVDLALGDVASAEDRYAALARRFPGEGSYLLGLAEVRLRQKRPEEAAELVEKALADEDLAPRHRALGRVLQARALVAATAGREDPERCEETAPPVRAWLDAAERALAAADAVGVDLPAIAEARRLVLRRRAMVDEACPPPPPPVLPSGEGG